MKLKSLFMITTLLSMSLTTKIVFATDPNTLYLGSYENLLKMEELNKNKKLSKDPISNIVGYYILKSKNINSDIEINRDHTFSWQLEYNDLYLTTRGIWTYDSNNEDILLTTSPKPSEVKFQLVDYKNMQEYVNPNYDIKIKITDANGTPIKNIGITCEGSMSTKSGKTDIDGIFVCERTGVLSTLTLNTPNKNNTTVFKNISSFDMSFVFDYQLSLNTYFMDHEKFTFKKEGLDWDGKSINSKELLNYIKITNE